MHVIMFPVSAGISLQELRFSKQAQLLCSVYISLLHSVLACLMLT